MSQDLNVNQLRALIRITIPIRELKKDIEHAIHLELYDGNGDLFIQLFDGLRQRVLQIVDDAYVDNLNLMMGDHASDRQKASQVLMLTGQLLSYLESETGTYGLVQGGKTSIQTAPHIIVNNSGASDKTKQECTIVERIKVERIRVYHMSGAYQNGAYLSIAEHIGEQGNHKYQEQISKSGICI